MTLITIDQFRKEVREGRKPSAGVFRVSTEAPLDVEGAARTKRFCFSDNAIDRMGDTIDADGWELADFNRNPVALWAHDSSQPPIGRASNVVVEGNRLMGDIEFASPETYAFADTIFRLLVDKFLNAVSVGFIPLEYSFVDNDPDRGFGIDFKRQTLLEISVCPVPANPNALANARAKGIDTRPLIEMYERLLASDEQTIIPRAELERLRKAAKEPPMATKPKPTLRADDSDDDENKPKGKCGRGKDAACGMTDPEECSIHGKTRAEEPVDPDDEKALRRALRRLLRAADPDDAKDPDDAPIAHEDAIRMAHKCLRTSKAFLTEGMLHHAKAVDLLSGVVDALDEGDPEQNPPDDNDPEGEGTPGEKARLARALKRRSRLTAV